MDIVDQPLDDRLPPLQAALPRTDGVTKLTFDHRIHRFGLLTLTKQTIQARLRNYIGSHPAVKVQQTAATPNRRDQIVLSNGLTIKARVSHHHPGFVLTLVMSTPAGISPQTRQISHIAAWSPARTPARMNYDTVPTA